MRFTDLDAIPIGSMYAIYGNIYHQYTPNVSIYTIHGSYGIWTYLDGSDPPSPRSAASQTVLGRSQGKATTASFLVDFASEVRAQSDFPEENDWKGSVFLNWDRIKKHPKLCLNLDVSPSGTSSEDPRPGYANYLNRMRGLEPL